MPVSITWSNTAGGAGITSKSHGSSFNGNNTTATQVFIRHDGANAITGCGFYIAQKSASYTGSNSAAADFAELKEWGDGNTADSFGGFQINMDAVGGFSGGSSWGMSESQKTATDGKKVTCRTGVGDSQANKFLLPTSMSASMTTPGEIPSGVTNASFQIRLKVPVTEGTAGTRQFDQVLVFTYTS